MAGITAKSFDSADEVRTPDKTEVAVIDLGGTKAARTTFQPGWRWSECIKPVVGGDACQIHHVGVVVSGRLHVTHGDGTEVELTGGNAYVVEPGHDAYVVGDEAFVAYEFDSQAAETYANPS